MELRKEGYIPIVAVQEHGVCQPWATECCAGLARKGWKALAAGAVRTEQGGTSAGTLLAVPSCLGVSMAEGQLGWDISPPGCSGRAVLATVQVGGIGWVAAFSLYLWTGESLATPGNAAILDAVVGWVHRLGLPWVATAD